MSSKESTDAKGKEYKLRTANNKSLVLEDPTSDFEIVNCTKQYRCFVVEDKSSKIQYRFLPPLTSYSSIHNKSVRYFLHFKFCSSFYIFFVNR